MKIACILMAAGTGERFGGNKLMTQLAGKPIIEYILGSLPVKRFSQCIGVSSDFEVLSRIEAHGLTAVRNDLPTRGISRTIMLGIQHLDEPDACMFCVADQPLLQRQTIEDMIDSYLEGTLLSLSSHGKRGNPVIFPETMLGELSDLQRGEYGTKVIYKHKGLLLLHDIPDATQLLDIDNRRNFTRISKIMNKAIS